MSEEFIPLVAALSIVLIFFTHIAFCAYSDSFPAIANVNVGPVEFRFNNFENGAIVKNNLDQKLIIKIYGLDNITNIPDSLFNLCPLQETTYSGMIRRSKIAVCSEDNNIIAVTTFKDITWIYLSGPKAPREKRTWIGIEKNDKD